MKTLNKYVGLDVHKDTTAVVAITAGPRSTPVLRALAYKWTRILWRCWHDRVPYAEARYHAALAQRKSPLAAQLHAA